jgi:hypothetical protein
MLAIDWQKYYDFKRKIKISGILKVASECAKTQLTIYVWTFTFLQTCLPLHFRP